MIKKADIDRSGVDKMIKVKELNKETKPLSDVPMKRK